MTTIIVPKKQKKNFFFLAALMRLFEIHSGNGYDYVKRARRWERGTDLFGSKCILLRNHRHTSYSHEKTFCLPLAPFTQSFSLRGYLELIKRTWPFHSCKTRSVAPPQIFALGRKKKDANFHASSEKRTRDENERESSLTLATIVFMSSITL